MDKMADEKTEQMTVINNAPARITWMNWMPAVTAVAALTVTLGGIMSSGITSIRGDIAAERQDTAILAMRLTAVEHKDDGYDRLVEQRNIQWQQLGSDMSSIRTTMLRLERDSEYPAARASAGNGSRP